MKFTHANPLFLIGILTVLGNFNAYGGTIVESSKSNISGSLTFEEVAQLVGTIKQNGTLASGYLEKNVELAEVKLTATDSKSYAAIKWQTPADNSNSDSLTRNIYEANDTEKKNPLVVKIGINGLEQVGDWLHAQDPGFLNATISSAQGQDVKPGVYNFEILSAGWYDD